jgi:alanyl-tRNA synthetase
MKADLLREKFLDFYKSKGHRIVESDSLVPRDDPTVLFTPAGMNQFKKQFLGSLADFRRATSSQRCLRTDDLDKVGKTRGHHTFFEMLGNFSFGDYFKRDAITWAWEFLTGELKIKEDRLWVSVYKDDDEAYQIWKDTIRVPAVKIVKLGDKANFWPSEAKEKGPNGPCGPCSEIFFDQGKDVGCGRKECDPGCGCGRFLEVWNLVFTQFNRKDGGGLEPLPQKNIDTGMGLERLAAVMQGTENNFETDLFKPLIQEILSKCSATETLADRQIAKLSNERGLVYAIADHVRAVVFAIYDGVLPSNDGRGYVIRKLIRKSNLHLRALGFTKPFLYKLVPVLAQIMERPYPEIKGRRENIAEVILSEEKSFLSILDSSNVLFSEQFSAPHLKSDSVGTAEVAYRLYDTYGMPLDITLDWLEKNGFQFSQKTFDKRAEEQKARSKSQSAMKGDVFDIEALHADIKETKFEGYRDYEAEGKILKILKDTAEVESIRQGDEARIILDRTPFYGESGGQVGDSGIFVSGTNQFEVSDTKRIDKVIVHIGRVIAGDFKKSDRITAKVDKERRLAIARNHTATHLLQAALRKVLGAHVQQQGSLVAEDRLRFDFTHFKDVTDDELGRIEEVVNRYVLDNQNLITVEMPVTEAKKSGALAFFGEKYEASVRVISISDISKELCGGTHLTSTGQIGLFKIIQEGSVASGVRRIEAITGESAYKAVKEEDKTIADIAHALGVPSDKIEQELERRLAKIKELEKQLQSLKIEALKNSVESVLKGAENINGIQLIIRDYPNADMDILRNATDLIKARTDNAVIVLTTSSNLSISIAMAVTPDACAKGIDASKLIKEIAPQIGGSGGGRKDFAQAGGNKPENREDAIKKLKAIINQIKP